MNQLRLKIDLKAAMVYTAIFILFIVCSFLNKDKGDSLENIAFNFFVPLFLFFVGLSIKELPKWLTYLFVGLGIISLVYMTLYYGVGFHNPYWGN